MDTLYLLNASRRLDDLFIARSLDGIDPLREVRIISFDEFTGVLDDILERSWNPERKRVMYEELWMQLRKPISENLRIESGKVIIFDQDFAAEDINWAFGQTVPIPGSLGYLFLSTARFQDEVQARYWLRHEFGHMFGAPSKGRTNTYESLGPHCSNRGCVMQQKLTVHESLKYSHKRVRMGAPIYCSQCEDDIRNFSLH